jgi:stalled ribosome rescue protein Dom34
MREALSKLGVPKNGRQLMPKLSKYSIEDNSFGSARGIRNVIEGRRTTKVIQERHYNPRNDTYTTNEFMQEGILANGPHSTIYKYRETKSDKVFACKHLPVALDPKS